MKPNADSSPDPWRVICLCAQWCGVCREWRDSFIEAAHAHPAIHFVWIDVEDEAHAMGDIDIETFPTLLIAQGAKPRFFGPVQPSLAQVNRLLASLTETDATSREALTASPLLARLFSTMLLN